MIVYLSLYLIPGFFLLNFIDKNNHINIFFWRTCLILFVIFVGMRNGINDWYLYELLYQNISHSMQVRLHDSLSFILILKLSAYFNINFQILIFFFSFISIFILFHIASGYENPWIVIVISIPLVVVMLYMGFIRQGLAFSIILLSIKTLIEKKVLTSLLLIFLAFTFHFSAIFFLFLLISQLSFSTSVKKIFYFIFPILVILFFIIYFNIDYIERTIFYYAGSGNYFQSKGAYFRIILNILPVCFYYYFYQDLNFSDVEKKIINLFIIFLLFLIPCSFLFSTLADRFNYYLVPLQFIIYSRLYSYCKKKKFELFCSIYIFLLSFFTLVGWFVFGSTSSAWLPYQFNINFFQDSLFLGKEIKELILCRTEMIHCLPKY